MSHLVCRTAPTTPGLVSSLKVLAIEGFVNKPSVCAQNFTDIILLQKKGVYPFLVKI